MKIMFVSAALVAVSAGFARDKLVGKKRPSAARATAIPPLQRATGTYSPDERRLLQQPQPPPFHCVPWRV